MKKSLLSILTLALVAVGCQNYDDQFDSLNTQITALTTKVDGLPPDTSAAITAINNAISALQTTVGTLGTSDLSAADLTTSLVGVLEQIAAVKVDLDQLDTQVAANIAGVEGVATTVAALTSDLSDVATAQLTGPQIAALVAVNDTTAELALVQESLNELLAADASVNGDLNIRNQAELDYAATLIDATGETAGVPKTYIINGSLTVDATGAYAANSDYTTAINALTSKITSVIGNVTVTSASNIATGTIDLTRLAYVSGGFEVAGYFNPTLNLVTTAAVVKVPINDPYTNFSIPGLISSSGGVVLTNSTSATVVSITNVDFSACTSCGAITTAAGKLEFPGATVNLGNGSPAATTTVGSLISTSITALSATTIKAVANATTGADGSVSINSLTVSATKIYANGTVTLGNSGATSTWGGGSVVFATGPIVINAKKINGLVSVVSNTLSQGNITLGALEIGLLTAVASGTGIIDASALTENTLGALSLSAVDVTLTGLITNTAAFTIVNDADLQLPALESCAGAITAVKALIFNAPKLVTNGVINLKDGTTAVDGANITVKHLADIADLADRTTLNIMTVKAGLGTVALDFSTFVLMETLNYAGVRTAAGTDQTNAITYIVNTLTAGTTSLTAVSLAGSTGVSTLTIKAPLLASLVAEGAVRTLIVSGTSTGVPTGGISPLTTINLASTTGINSGGSGTISIINSGISTLDLSNWGWLGNIEVTGNVSMATMAFPTLTTTATSIGNFVNKTVTVTANGLDGTFTQGVTRTSAVAFVETTIPTTGLTNAKTFLTWLTNESTAGGVTYTIEIDDITAAIVTASSWRNAGGSTDSVNSSAIWDNNGNINTILELALLPN